MVREEDELAEEFRKAESGRMRKLIGLSAVVLALFVGGAVYLVTQGSGIFRPNLDVEAGEDEILAATNDPLCRGILDDVMAAGADFRERQDLFIDAMLSNDEAQVDQVYETATAFRSRMEAIAERIDDAVLRERTAPRQMKSWFSKQDHEFELLQRLAQRQLQTLRGEEVEELGGLWQDPPELRDAVLMTTTENFEEFRVWVASGGHPCGAAPELD